MFYRSSLAVKIAAHHIRYLDLRKMTTTMTTNNNCMTTSATNTLGTTATTRYNHQSSLPQLLDYLVSNIQWNCLESLGNNNVRVKRKRDRVG